MCVNKLNNLIINVDFIDVSRYIFIPAIHMYENKSDRHKSIKQKTNYPCWV